MAPATQCTPTKELTEGPFYVANEPTRQNFAEGVKGMPLINSFHVVDATTCKPIPIADVEIWHADPEGEYSAFDGAAKKTSYLRGHQIANAKDVAKFITVLPGWYPGRAPHIHLKVHVDGRDLHTGQVFFKPTSPRRSTPRLRTPVAAAVGSSMRATTSIQRSAAAGLCRSNGVRQSLATPDQSRWPLIRVAKYGNSDRDLSPGLRSRSENANS